MNLKAILIIAGCSWLLWHTGRSVLGYADKVDGVTMLTETNFYEVQRDGQTLLAIYSRPG
jgi:hypothetical protein